MKVCRVEGCGKKHNAHGYCGMHARRMERYGDLELPTREQRFWAKVQKADDCWNWTGAGSQVGLGYGRFSIGGGRDALPHRYAYELLVGPIPHGLVLDHLCRNPRCVNPAHLEPVTHQENILRGIGPSAVNAQKTHCKRGHEFTPENTYWHKRGARDCRECRRAASRRARAKAKGRDSLVRV